MSEIPTIEHYCDRHPDVPVRDTCAQCGANICQKCIDASGYFCSDACKTANQAEREAHDSVADVESAEQTFASIGKVIKLGVLIALPILAIVVLVLAWKYILSPHGKVTWTWEHAGKMDTVRIVNHDAEKLMVITSKTVAALNLKNGEVISEAKHQGLDIKAGTQFYDTGNGVICKTRYRILQIDYDGKTVLNQDLIDSPSMLTVSPDKTRAYYIDNVPWDPGKSRPMDAEYYRKASNPSSIYDFYAYIQKDLVALDLVSGRELWRNHLHTVRGYRGKFFAKVTLGSLAASTNYALAIITVADLPEDFDKKEVWDTVRFGGEGGIKYRTYITALNRDTGKVAWRQLLGTTESSLTLNVWQDSILLQLATELRYMADSGETKWTLEVSKIDGYSRAFIKGNRLFVRLTSGTRCYDLGTGRQIWQTPYNLRPDSMITGKVRLYFWVDDTVVPGNVQAQEGEEVEIDPYRGARKVITCLAMTDGKELWKIRDIPGTVYGDDERLCTLWDTRLTGQYALKGELVLNQYDVETGKHMLERASKPVFRTPILIGDRLIGRSHIRLKRPDVIDQLDAMTGADGGGELPDTTGIAALRLK